MWILHYVQQISKEKQPTCWSATLLLKLLWSDPGKVESRMKCHINSIKWIANTKEYDVRLQDLESWFNQYMESKFEANRQSPFINIEEQ